MFDDRNKSFLRQSDLASDYRNREVFAISLRKKKRYKLLDQKRQKISTHLTSASPDLSTVELDLQLSVLDQAQTLNERLNLWTGVSNTAKFLQFQLGSSTFSNLLTAIHRYLDLKYTADVLEVVTLILIKISNLDDSVLAKLDFHRIVPQLLLLFEFPNDKVQDNAIHVLGNLFASNLTELQTHILACGFWKSLKKATVDPVLFETIAWAARNASCIQAEMTESYCENASRICKVILESNPLKDETLKLTLSTLAHVAKNGGQGFDFQNFDHVFKYFHLFPSQALRAVGYILMNDQRIVVQMIQFNLLNHLDHVIYTEKVSVKQKTWWVLGLLCKTGIWAIKLLMKHPMFQETLNVPMHINDSSKLVWCFYIEALLKNCEEETRVELMTEHLAETVFRLCSESSKRLKEQCSMILWMFVDIWGIEKFFMTEVGISAQSLMNDEEYNLGYFEDYPVLRILDLDD